MHGRISLLGYVLGLLAFSNGSNFFDNFTVPFLYNEVKDPTSEDLESFAVATELVHNATDQTVGPSNILSFYKKVDFIRLSYKAYYRTDKGNICFVKWRVWATGMTSIVINSCDEDSSDESDEGEGPSSEKPKEDLTKTTVSAGRASPQKLREVKIVKGLSSPAVQLVGSRNAGERGASIFYIANSSVVIHGDGTVKWVARPNEDNTFAKGHRSRSEHKTPSKSGTLLSDILGDVTEPARTNGKHEGRSSFNSGKDVHGYSNYLVPKKKDTNDISHDTLVIPSFLQGVPHDVSDVTDDVDEHKNYKGFMNTGKDRFLHSGRLVLFNDADRNTDLSQSIGETMLDEPGWNGFKTPTRNATGRQRKKLKMFLGNRAWKTNNIFDSSDLSETEDEEQNRHSSYAQRSNDQKRSVKPLLVPVRNAIASRLHRIVRKPLKMNRK